MSETTTTTAPAPGTDPAAPTHPLGDVDPTLNEPDDGDDDLGDKGKKALRDERSARRAAEKALKTAQDTIAAADRAKMTEDQRRDADLADRTTRLTAAETRVAQYDAGLPLGLTPADCARLIPDASGSYEADAKAFAERLGTVTEPAPPPPARTRATATLRPGSGPPKAGADALNSDGLTNALKAKLGIPD